MNPSIINQIIKFISDFLSKNDSKEVIAPNTASVQVSESSNMGKITINELLNNKYRLEDQSAEIQKNLTELLEKVNKIRVLWGKSMIVTSGLRTMEDHLRIYAQKGITDQSKIPMKSKHLYGQAVDIYDPDLSITNWLKENDSKILVDINLWCEEGNKNWVHFQCVPYGSWMQGKSRWFLP